MWHVGVDVHLSGLVPGRLTNRLALQARAPCREEGEEVGDGDDAMEEMNL